MDNTYDRLVRSDRDHHIHPFSSPRRVREEGLRRLTVRTEGVYQVDNHGNRYIDAVSGLACVNIGYGREDMADAISQAIRTISFHPVFWECSNPYSAALVEKLNEVTPEYMTHFFFANSGSEANDTAIKLVRWFWKLQGKPEKKHIISREMAYHGMNLLTASLTGLEPCHPQFDLPIAGVSHIMAPWSWVHGTHQQDEAFGRQAAQALEDEILRIGADRVGAFIGEPTQATGCGISPPPGYWPEIERICRKHDVLLIADEVVTGFGRSGEWFAQQYFGFEADITVMAKGLSSAYFPVSAVALNQRVGGAITGDSGELYHGYTTSCHPVGAVAAVKNIEIIQQERLVERIRDELGPALESGLKALESHPLVGEVRGIGLGWAIQLTANKETREFFPPELGVDAMVAAHAYEKGVIIRDLGGDTLGVSPPFVTTDEQLVQILDAIEYGLDAAQRELGGIPDR
ncbi:MAG: aminotransferase class III-fold pyridoxal phosphate-dependent enzyme [Proteobacteria bacterium]|nr:aminotransferase class III-fold pyridoxal phosphate-dependent enzyme [Pseudomonadota bacterium]